MGVADRRRGVVADGVVSREEFMALLESVYGTEQSSAWEGLSDALYKQAVSTPATLSSVARHNACLHLVA